MFKKMEPLALFNDWSPPRQLSDVTITPTRVLSSSDFDKDHGAHMYVVFSACLALVTRNITYMFVCFVNRILETGCSYWRSAAPTSNEQREEWLSVQFNAGVTLSAITLAWHPEYIPSRYSIGVSADGSSHETVAIVVDGAAKTRIAFAKVQQPAP